MSESTSGSSILTSLGNPSPAAAPPSADQSASPAAAATPTAKAWYSDFEAEFANEPSFAKIREFQDGPKGVVKSYINLEKMLGGERVARPKADDDAEGWDRWYDAAGRPKTAEEYELKRPDSMPDGFYSEDMEKSFRTWSRENGLNKKQAGNLYEAYVKTRLESQLAWQKQQNESKAAAEQAIRREFGDGYQAAMDRVKAAYQKFADPEFAKYLEESGEGNNPRMLRVFEKIGREMQGETRLKGQASVETQPADLDRAIADYRGKYNEALFRRDHPDHEMRAREYRRLFEQRYPD